LILRRLSLRGFRNLEPQDLEFPAEGVAVLGENAQGKSNLLESIYYLETFRSFRGAQDAQLVSFDADVFRVEGTVEPSRTVAAAYDKSQRKKRVTVDGAEVPSLISALGSLGAVVFSPSDIHVIDGGPVERRRFLDIVLSLNADGYVNDLQRYRQALAQRNAALKSGSSTAAVLVWDEGLAQAGAALITQRAEWVAGSSEFFAQTYQTISGGERAQIAYRTSCAVEPGGTVLENLKEALADRIDRDRRLGSTSVGPHRDELRISFEGTGREVRTYGSGGQRRTAALALRLVEAETVRATKACAPLVLLDDAFAELDEPRSERLLGLIDSGDLGQVILTAPKESDVRVRTDTLPRWRIERGRLVA